MALILSRHLTPELNKRHLKLAFIEATVTNPDWTMPDPSRPGVTRSFRAIPEFGNRVLRVAHRPENTDVFVLTAFWDRGAKR
jgi:hypothetical protein